MKNEQYKFLGITITKEVPATNEEFDKAAGELNSAAAEATDHYMFHNWGAKFREAFCLAVEKETGIAWPLDETAMAAATPKKDGTVSDVHISHKTYFQRVLAETKRTVDSFQELANTVAQGIAFDPSASSGGGRIGKEFTTAAEGVLEKGAEAVARVVGQLNTLNPGLNVSDSPSVEELARAIKANAERKRREANAELGL